MPVMVTAIIRRWHKITIQANRDIVNTGLIVFWYGFLSKIPFAILSLMGREVLLGDFYFVSAG